MQLKYGLNNNPVLTPLQKKVLHAVSQDAFLSQNFYLTGGTALSAFYLEHRYSEDLDFFTHHQSLENVHKILALVCDSLSLTSKSLQSSPYFCRYLVQEELKLDFVVDIPQRMGSPILVDGILVDDFLNIAINKICTILGRLDAKDYVDLYFILKNSDLNIEKLIEWGKQKDGGLEPFIWASIIGDVDTFQLLPRMIKPLSLKELRVFYSELRDKILLSLKPTR